ncbi:LLM class flavin-dependent oxidoreductase [Deinococcus cellulosilyticus]|uniref:Alkanal monooxygenase n=1 Tax=Deinococcus cellulosilyticus (strain DSM 18568 / NBRC 106333 / KACC 11606 / 5516J-15) TaxID=1223518 RepID=A0A511N2L7_DEIC1|nr:LLM class flavin-dependent oxidoreductase [Deinococcus cellulosilyticus]GEM46757.1 alkanal monooxygenase [Deinococcus cellulosilyticus NBRC 106333 = KACC 11606]
MSTHPKKVGFLTFGHWQGGRGSHTPTATEALTQTIELAVEAEKAGLDGAFLRVHHFAKHLSAPFPLLAAMAARTQHIELGTAVIDMRYENPLGMAEEAAITDLISGGRLQLGLSRGSPEQAYKGYEAFGYIPQDGQSVADYAKDKTELFRAAIQGKGMVSADAGGRPSQAMLPVQPQSATLQNRIWWGAGTRSTAVWAGEQGMHLMSSTLMTEDTGVPFGELQAEQIALFREAWHKAGWVGEPRVSVSRSILPITSDFDRYLFGGHADTDQVGILDGARSRFGRSYVGEPDVIAQELQKDPAVQSADTLLLTVPNQLGVEYNARMLQTIATHIAPSIGWRPASESTEMVENA